jgi:NAD(P)-dependent dehydrogenase (short-subunit alcohol dehydrogenase family)
MTCETRPSVAVVVGGAGGIGSAVVRRFSSDGIPVAIGDQDTREGEQLACELGDGVQFFRVDVLDQESIDAFTAELAEAYGSIDHLISLAGGSLEGEYKGFKVLTPEMIHGSIDLNLKSHLFLVRALLPLLSAGPEGDRSITFVSSINAIKDYGLPAYSAAKAGLLGLVYPLATELGERQIRVNALLPGTVMTERTAHLPRRLDDSRKNGTALNRFATSEEIADVAWGIAKLMTCVTGQSIVADCGQSMRGYPLFPAE